MKTVRLHSNSEFTEPKIGVVIRSLNEAEHLPKLIFGLKRQTLRVSDIVLVDSGSSDGTCELAKELGLRVVCTPKEEFSFGKSLNIGFEEVDADIVLILSAHVYPKTNNFINDMLGGFNDPNVGYVYGRQIGNSDSAFSERQLMLDWYPPHPKTNYSNFSNNGNSAVKKSVWDLFKFDEKLPGLEDIDFASRINTAGWTTNYAHKAIVTHVHNEKWSKIANRYRREAFALCEITQEKRMTPGRAMNLFARHVLRDVNRAKIQGVLQGEITSILSFRSAQFYGSLKGTLDSQITKPEIFNSLFYPQSIRKNKAPALTQDSDISYPESVEQL